MSTGESLKPSGPWEVHRSIRIPSLGHAADGLAVERAVSELPGMIKVIANVERQRVGVRYNASLLSYQRILETLEETGFPPRNNWWSRLKGNWYNFSEENIRDNAKAPPPACCNKPPK
jgi:copper chaperone CopZ